MRNKKSEKKSATIIEPSRKFARDYIQNINKIPNKELKKIKKTNKAFELCLISGLCFSLLTTPFIIGTIACSINSNKVEKEMQKALFTETEEYRTIYKSEIESLEERFKNGELSGTEYLQLVENLGSDEFVEKTMNSATDLPSAKETKQVKEINSKTLAAGLCAAGSFVASLGLTQAGVRLGKHGDKLEEKFKQNYPFYKNVEFYR